MSGLPGLVIFDCDGVLVDTETMANRRLAQWLCEAGFPVTFEHCRKRFTGRSMSSVQEEIEAAGISLGADFVGRWNAGLPDLFAAGVEAIPNVRDVVEALRLRGVSYCVASSAQVPKMHITLGATGLLPLFEHVLFSATMVPRGKPFRICSCTPLRPWARSRTAASSSRTAFQALSRASPPACVSFPIAPIPIPTAKASRRRAAPSSRTCGSFRR